MVRDKFLILVIIFLFVLNLFTLGYLFFERQMPPPPPDDFERVIPLDDKPGREKMQPPGKPDRLIEKLKFSEAQAKQMEDLKREHKNKIDQIQDSSRKLHDEYFGFLKTDSYDKNKAAELLEKISANQKELDAATFEHFEKIKALCTNEQKTEFVKMLDEIAHSLKQPPPKR